MAHNAFQKHEQTVQELQNRGFDPTFDVPAVEVLGYDDGGNALRRIAVDGDGKQEVVLDISTLATETTLALIKNTDGIKKITDALPAGTNAIGKLAANSGVDIGDVDVTSISAGTNLIGDVGIQPRTSNGLTIFRSIDLDETEEEVKATAGQVFGWYIQNKNAATLFVKFYNATAANTTVGTTTPVMTLPIPAGSAANAMSDIGIAFSTAITVAATTGVADADTGAPAANDLIINVYYK